MAKLFDEIFTDRGSGDIILVFACDPHDRLAEDRMRLWCHSLILTQQPYFYKMLNSGSALRESRKREIIISDCREDVIELIRFIYTGQIDINHLNVAGILTLADKYCIDEVLDLCLKYVRDNFDPSTFFTFYNCTALNTSFQEKLKEQLMLALRIRRNLFAVTQDERWQDLPIDFVEEILSQDDLPISSEAEVLTLIGHWVGGRQVHKQEMARLLGTFRRYDNLQISVPQLSVLLKALGYDLFAPGAARNGSGLWDPPLVLHRHEAAGNINTSASLAEAREAKESPHGEICHQMGPKDYLQQEPGWMHPGVHRLRVTLKCTSWSHRERRLLRSGRAPIEAAALQKRAFECNPAKTPGHERSPSPPPKFQVRKLPATIEAFETFDLGQMPADVSENERLIGGGSVTKRRNISPAHQDKIDHELVDHQIICSVVSGAQRHGVRFSQHEPNAIYYAEDLTGKRGVQIGGDRKSVV